MKALKILWQVLKLSLLWLILILKEKIGNLKGKEKMKKEKKTKEMKGLKNNLNPSQEKEQPEQGKTEKQKKELEELKNLKKQRTGFPQFPARNGQKANGHLEFEEPEQIPEEICQEFVKAPFNVWKILNPRIKPLSDDEAQKQGKYFSRSVSKNKTLRKFLRDEILFATYFFSSIMSRLREEEKFKNEEKKKEELKKKDDQKKDSPGGNEGITI